MAQASLIEPLAFTLTNGEEKHFILSAKTLRLALERQSSLAALSTRSFEVLIAVLYKSCIDAGDLTEDQFELLLPADPELLQGFFDALQKASSPPANEKYRPIKAGENGARASAGYSHSGEPA